jgi:Predicted membrane protein (DUF2306)
MRFPLLVLHVSAGILAMLAGAFAISFRKGSRRHRTTGNMFVICMLIVSAVGAWLAFKKSEADNVLGGIFTFYLIATAWTTARRGEAEIWNLDWATPPGCTGCGSNLVFLGNRGNAWPNGRRGSKFRRGVLFLRCLGPVVRGGGCAHAPAWRGFWETTSLATSLAHVLWMVCRYDLLLPWSAAGISPLVAGINRACGASVLAIATFGFLGCPGSLYKRVPKRMGAKWPGPIAGRRSGGTTENEWDCGMSEVIGPTATGRSAARFR